MQMGFLIFKVLILISPAVQWHMMNPSESILILRLRIDSLTGFWMSIIHFIIKIFLLMKESMSVQHTIIETSLRDITPTLLSIEMKVNFPLNV